MLVTKTTIKLKIQGSKKEVCVKLDVKLLGREGIQGNRILRQQL
jgi:hypothetical protein